MLKKILPSLAVALLALQGTSVRTELPTQETFESLKKAINNAVEKGSFGVLRGERTPMMQTIKKTYQDGSTSTSTRHYYNYDVHNPSQDTRDDQQINELALKLEHANLVEKEKTLLWALLLTKCMQRTFECDVAGHIKKSWLTPYSICKEAFNLGLGKKIGLLAASIGISIPICLAVFLHTEGSLETKDLVPLTTLGVIFAVIGILPGIYFFHKIENHHNLPVLKNIQGQIFELTTTFKDTLPAELCTHELQDLFNKPKSTDYFEAESLWKKQQEAFVAYFQKVSSIASKIR